MIDYLLLNIQRELLPLSDMIDDVLEAEIGSNKYHDTLPIIAVQLDELRRVMDRYEEEG